MNITNIERLKTKTLNATNIKCTKAVNLINFIECLRICLQPLKFSESSQQNKQLARADITKVSDSNEIII